VKVAVLFLIVGFLCLTACNPQASSPPANGESAPPTTTETEPEPEPRLVEVPLSYEVVETYVKEDVLVHQSSIEIGGIGSAEDTWEEPIFIACVTIKNTDLVSGTFTVSFSVDNPLDDFFLTTTLELAPGETETAECPAYSLGDWSYEVIPSTKLNRAIKRGV
jgi:hypothetical protein